MFVSWRAASVFGTVRMAVVYCQAEHSEERHMARPESPTGRRRDQNHRMGQPGQAASPRSVQIEVLEVRSLLSASTSVATPDLADLYTPSHVLAHPSTGLSPKSTAGP